MKNCFKCNTKKELSEFYKHPQMLDGHVNKCKECNKSDVNANRLKNIDHYKAFDKKRALLPHRVQARKDYISTENGKAAKARAGVNYRNSAPNVYKASRKFANAIKSGSIKRQFHCSKCSSDINVEGHHDDYNKPLEVRWLCSRCHTQWHKSNTALNRK